LKHGDKRETMVHMKCPCNIFTTRICKKYATVNNDEQTFTNMCSDSLFNITAIGVAFKYQLLTPNIK